MAVRHGNAFFQLSKLLSILPISGKLKKKHFSAVEKNIECF
jgi:hypothetical protein